MTPVELVVRSGAGTAALILAVALFRARHSSLRSRLFGALLCFGVAGYLAYSGSPSARSTNWWSPGLILASAVPFFFWGWTTSIMDDDARTAPATVAAAALLVGIAVAGARVHSAEWRFVAVVLHSVLGIGFVVAALVNVLHGWREDLVEARRRLRALILVLCGGYSVSVLVVELILRGEPPSQTLLLVNAVLLAALLFGLACAVLDVSSSVRAAFGWIEPQVSEPVEPAEVAARDRERELVARLQELMTRDATYRDANIVIASLAVRLGVTEKKLRDLINRRLGFKNFPSYVNAFRLEEVRRRLIDPSQDEVPILTMALEAGFGSVVAFNRAFKDRYGLTPSAYRTQRGDSREPVSR